MGVEDRFSGGSSQLRAKFCVCYPFMMRFTINFAAAVTAWAATATCAATSLIRSDISGTCSEDLGQLGKKLSNSAKIYCPGSPEFEKASTRWSVLDAPKVNIVVVPGTEQDVAITVCICMNASRIISNEIAF